jgi:ParB/Sulfiredoxin domain
MGIAERAYEAPKVKVDSEFQSLIAPLLPEEFAQLEANILSDGCREPISVWKTDNGALILLDGHNRHAICTKRQKRYEIREIKLPNRESAKLWILTQQLGRRNLTDDQRAVIADRVLQLRIELGKVRRKKNLKKGAVHSPDADTVSPSGKSREAVAKEHKVPVRKLRRAKKVREKDPALSEKVVTGEITLQQAERLADTSPVARQEALKAIDKGTSAKDVLRNVRQIKEVAPAISKLDKSPLGKDIIRLEKLAAGLCDKLENHHKREDWKEVRKRIRKIGKAVYESIALGESFFCVPPRPTFKEEKPALTGELAGHEPQIAAPVDADFIEVEPDEHDRQMLEGYRMVEHLTETVIGEG